jgi:hypothetical protein
MDRIISLFSLVKANNLKNYFHILQYIKQFIAPYRYIPVDSLIDGDAVKGTCFFQINCSTKRTKSQVTTRRLAFFFAWG